MINGLRANQQNADDEYRGSSDEDDVIMDEHENANYHLKKPKG